MKALCPTLLMCFLLTLQYGCDTMPESEAGEAFSTLSQEIRNGTREPTLVALSEGQKLSIGWLHQSGSPGSNFCTGTLIAPRVVATASHCTEGWRAQQISFGIGLRPATARASFQVTQIHEHPRVDAAILILGEDATARVPELEPIVANTITLSNTFLGNTVEASGYGETYDSSRDGRWFAALELESIGSSYVVVNGNGQRGICFGDSGGPLLSTLSGNVPVLLAVESNGDSSCLGRDNMTRLDAIASWMTSVAGALPTVDDVGPGGNDTCAGLDYQGRCSGDVAEWCQNAQVESLNCASQNQICGYVDDEIGYYCMDAVEDNTPQPETPPSGTNDLCDSSESLCDGTRRVVCSGGTLLSENCADIGAVCSFSDNGEPICVVLEDGDMSGNQGGLLGGDASPGWADTPDNNAWNDDGARGSGERVVVNEGCSLSPLATTTPGAGPFALIPALLGALLVIRRQRRQTLMVFTVRRTTGVTG